MPSRAGEAPRGSPQTSKSTDRKGKGKATSPFGATSAPVPPTTDVVTHEEEENGLVQLAEAITASAHFLAPGNGDAQLANQAKRVLKASFDRALQSEGLAFPHLSTLMQSLLPSAGPSTRASSARAIQIQEAAPVLSLSLTPLQELTVEAEMDHEMIWEQMELRSTAVVELLEEMFGGERDGSRRDGDDGEEDEVESSGELEEEDDSGSEDSDAIYGEDDEDDSEEGENTPFEESEYVSKLTTAVPHPSERRTKSKSTAESDSDSDERNSPEPPTDLDPTSSLTLSTFDAPSSSTAPRGRKASGPPSSVDSGFFSLHDFHVQTDEGEFEMAKAMRGEVDEDEEDDGVDLFAAVADSDDEDLDNAGIMYDDFFEPPPRPFVEEKRPAKGKKGKGINPKPATLALADPLPSASTSTTAAAATTNGTTLKKKRSVKFSEVVKVKAIPARGSEFDKLVEKVGWEKAEEITVAAEADLLDDSSDVEDEEEGDEMEDDEEERYDGEEDEMLKMLAEEGDEDMEEDEDDENEAEGEEYESEDDEGIETIERMKQSLFEEDDENSEDDSVSPAAALTRHERRLVALSNQIADLEAENVGAKNWATKGEAKSRDRPVNSLLEEDLEYERSGKVVPVITEETTKGIEELIKKRILDNDFDDVIRQRQIDPNAFLPSRFMELQDVKSSKSLAEIYEEDFTNAREKEAGNKVVAQVDKDLEKKHAEIEDLFDELSGKLDALSNARFTPKPPKSAITTISNVASITLESALPTAVSTSTLLAPEETFVPDPTNEDRSDFTPSQKKTARQKRRKARASMAKAADQFTKGTKGEKERATKELVGTKGVTVIGKNGKKEGLGAGAGGKRKREAGDVGESGRSGVALKL